MSSTYLKTAFTLLLFIITLSSCSKNSNNNPTGPGNGSTYPKFILPNVIAPESKSSTADTSQGYLEVNGDNSLLDSVGSSLSAQFTGNPTDSADTWIWVFHVPQDTITGTWTATPDSGEYYWTFTVASPEISIRYLAGLVAGNGKSGNLDFLYNPMTNVPAAKYTWITKSDGQLDGTIYVSNFLGIKGRKYVFTNNTDKSGTLNEWSTLYDGSEVQTWDIIWNANQSGRYTEWDTTGTIIDSGTWN